MATIEKRGLGQWRAKIRKRGYPAQSHTFDTKAKAERWARKVESEMDDGIFSSHTEAEKTTFRQLMTRYRDEITKSKKGVDAETSRLNAMMKRPIFSRRLSTLSNSDFAAYRDERLTTVTGDTVLKELTLMGHAIDIAVKEWGIHLPTNPVKQIRRPAPGKPRDRRLSPDEEKTLYKELDQATRNPYIRPLVETAIETGMRRSELLKLRWEHINLDACVAHLPDTKNSDYRDVPLSSRAVCVLRDLKETDDPRVFPTTADSLKKAFQRAVQRANIANLRYHDLRHEATSRLFEKGLNIMEVATITGHKDLRMLRRYTHLKAKDLAKKLG